VIPDVLRRAAGAAVGLLVLLAAAPGWAWGAATLGAASLTVTPGGGIDASTWNTGAFTIDNLSLQGVRIARVRIDLSTALLSDLVFDPLGQAGDTVAKCLTPDSNPGLVGLVQSADPCSGPFSAAHDGGYRVLALDFTDFRPGRSFLFSVDVDPTVIRGTAAPGPAESGSVSGLEMTGALVEFTFSDGAVLSAPLFPISGDDGGARATVRDGAIATPGIALVGVPSLPATLEATAQTVRLSGPPGAHMLLLRAEGVLDTTGLPGNGFDVDPFEADTVVGVEQRAIVLDASGFADVPIDLTRSGPDAGVNFLAATVEGPAARTGPLSPVLVAVPESCSDAPPRSPSLAMSGQSIAWSPLAGATRYDVVRGDLGTLRSTHGRYDLAVTGCLAFRTQETVVSDPATPPAGQAFFYLARGRSCGGAGTWDDGTGFGQVAPRDPSIAAAPSTCP